MGHNHDHNSTRNIKTAFFLNLTFTVVEIIGGMMTNSVAILADAVHDLGDSISLGVSWYLDKKSKQKRDTTFTFGYARFSLLGALITGVILLVGSVYIITEAVDRLYHPEEADAKGMVFLAILGVLVNSYAAWKLSKGKTMNERVVAWHLVEDMLGWGAVLVAAIVMLFWDIPFLDPALSILITLYILWNSIKRLKETIFLFLQGTPDNLNPTEIENKIIAIEGVESIHDLHLWSLDGESNVFTAHLRFKSGISSSEAVVIKNKVKTALKPYNFNHYTLETEWHDEDCEHS